MRRSPEWVFYFLCFCNPLAVFFEPGPHTRRRGYLWCRSQIEHSSAGGMDAVQPSPSRKFNRGPRRILPMILIHVVEISKCPRGKFKETAKKYKYVVSVLPVSWHQKSNFFSSPCFQEVWKHSLCDVTQGTFSQVLVPPFQDKALLFISFKTRTNKSSCCFHQKLKQRFFFDRKL